MKNIIMYKKEVDTFQYAKVFESNNGYDRSSSNFNNNQGINQFNIEISTTKKRYGVGLHQSMTQKEVGELLIKLGLDILKDYE